MNPTAFTFTPQGGDAYSARDVAVTLPDGARLTIGAANHCDRVTLRMLGDTCGSSMFFTAAQARAVAVELLACADVGEAVTMGRG